MKMFRAFFLMSLIVWGGALSAQNLPTNITVKNLKNESVSTGVWENDGKPMVVSFWATWCKPCILELSTIHDEYPDWQEETGVKVITVSIDDARNASKVLPFVNGKGWEYEMYIDENSDLKRAMNVVNIPHTFLIDGEGKIVYSHNSYAPGDEFELYDHILELSAQE
jgi:peroxiredoxin